MNVYDTANRLAKEIKEAPEYVEFKKAKQNIEQKPELKEKLQKFETLRYQMQMLSIQGTQNEELNKQMEEVYTQLIQNEETKNYLDLELKFNVLIGDVNKIIAEAVRDVLMN